MTLPFKTGKLGRFSFALPKFGVRGSLFMAFGVIAAMAILISVSASSLLGQLGGMMTELSDRDIPRLEASLQLSAQSGSLATQGNGVLASENDAQLQERLTRMKETQKIAAEKIAEVERLGADKVIVDALRETGNSIGDMVTSIGKAAKDRLDAVALRKAQTADLQKSHNEFLAAASIASLQAQTRLNAVLASANLSQSDAMESARAIDGLGNMIASGNQLAADMAAALTAANSAAIDWLKRTSRSKKEELIYFLSHVTEKNGGADLKKAVAQMIALSDGKGNVFEVRQKELDATEYGQLIIEETRKLNRGLEIGVKQLVEGVQAETSGSAKSAHAKVSIATLVMLGLGVLTLVGSGAFVWLYVGRNILARIEQLQRAMQRLSDGDLDVDIASGRRQDEIAAMARSLEVFRESMIESNTLSGQQNKERTAKAERASRMETQIARFEDKVRGALESLVASAGMMQTTAQSMSATADRSSALAGAVAAAAEETSVNVQTVSSGTEELSSSISEISRQVTSSAEIAANAVSDAKKTDATMQGLADNANRISSVVDLIQEIASQTNLLALNATIEAARAGEAGRGFAVVAAEVKSLAEQTAKATDDIRSQISSMQNVTASAVGAIRHIGSTIGEINEVTTAIAAAVEEQGAATREIAHNIQHAAAGTSDVSSNIVGVSEASTDAGAAACHVLGAAGELRREADTLRAEIDAFLLDIRAA